jgi:hypothetical protein
LDELQAVRLFGISNLLFGNAPAVLKEKDVALKKQEEIINEFKKLLRQMGS